MNKDEYGIILYPALAEKLTRKQKDFVIELVGVKEEAELDTILSSRITLDKIKDVTKKLQYDEKIEIYNGAKSICSMEFISYKQICALAELGQALNINSSDTGFAFDIYSDEERLDNEYRRNLINFSIYSSFAGVLPLGFFKYLLITSPLHIVLVNNICTLYGFKTDSKHLLRLVSCALGTNLLFRTIANLLSLFLPFKWIIRGGMAFATTYAVGYITRRYIEADGDISEDTVRSMFETAYDEGKDKFEKFREYMRKNKDKVFDIVKDKFRTV